MINLSYALKAKQTILNRVRFHAPVCFNADIDKTLLFNFGVDVRYPVFKFDKDFNANLIKAFELASEEEKFNLLLPLEKINKKHEKMLKKVKNCVFYSEISSNLQFLNMINKLNINYKSSSNYDFKFKDKFFKVNDDIINPTYKDFALIKEDILKDNVEFSYKEFLLNEIGRAHV